MKINTNVSDTFAVGINDLEMLVREALSRGGSYADLYFESTFYSTLMLRDGEVSSGGHYEDYGCGIRVLSGEKTGYAYSESTDIPSLLLAARAAGEIADGRSTCALAFGKTDFSSLLGNRYPMAMRWNGCDPAGFAATLKEIEQRIRKRDNRVSKVIAMLGWSESEVMMYNSFGELTSDLRPMGSLSVSVIFQDGKSTQTKSASRSFRLGAEFFCEENINAVVEESTSGIDEMFEAKRPKGGQMSVVMGAGASGILLHEAMGHAFEADFNRKGQSIFSDKMGRQICPKGINIVDDATITGCRGSLNYDDEGVPGQKTYMVTDGVLTSYLHDRISAAYYGVSPTGNGRRESFRYNPIPRMRATYMENGNSTREDLIASVKKGVYVDEFSNGEVKIGEGDFTFYVRSGFLIEDGRLTMPVKDINIIGNGPQALSDIRGVAADLTVDPGKWTCGKGQSVPVSCGIPSVLIDNLTVGGE